MKKLLWTLCVLTPFACSAQMVNNPASPITPVATALTATQVPPKTSTVATPDQGFAGALDQVRARLNLTASQQALWHAYEDSIDAYNRLHYREMPVVSSAGEKAPRQIGRLVDNLQNRLAALEDVEQASKQLYADLTAAQQLIADQMLLPTVPTFNATADSGNSPSGDSARQNGRSDNGMRSRRGGGTGGVGGGRGF